MESQPQNPEFRIYPENFPPWNYKTFSLKKGLTNAGSLKSRKKQDFFKGLHLYIQETP